MILQISAMGSGLTTESVETDQGIVCLTSSVVPEFVSTVSTGGGSGESDPFRHN